MYDIAKTKECSITRNQTFIDKENEPIAHSELQTQVLLTSSSSVLYISS